VPPSGRVATTSAADGISMSPRRRLAVTFTLVVANAGDPTWPDPSHVPRRPTAAGAMSPHTSAASIGLNHRLVQLTATRSFSTPATSENRALPLAERVAEGNAQPYVRARILSYNPVQGSPDPVGVPYVGLDLPAGDNPNYEPNPSYSTGAASRAQGCEPDG